MVIPFNKNGSANMQVSAGHVSHPAVTMGGIRAARTRIYQKLPARQTYVFSPEQKVLLAVLA
jgi:hypothetical protein